MSLNMVYSKGGLALTEGFESCVLIPYQDSGGIWTNGYGNTVDVKHCPTCKGKCPHYPITRNQALNDLARNNLTAVRAVNTLVKVPLTQNEFDALVDFQFNTGHLAGSTMLALLNKGDYPGAADEFDKWDHVKAKVVAGLLRRREVETELFLRPDKPAVDVNTAAGGTK